MAHEINSLNGAEAIALIDSTAQLCVWSDCGFWIKANTWETKIVSSERRAWELAVEMIAAGEVLA